MNALQDDMKFTDDNGDSVIFNHYSFCEWLKWIIVKFANKTYTEAHSLVMASAHRTAPSDYDEVTIITHELEFHWAMLLVHGDLYWHKGIPSDYNNFLEEYLQWESEIAERYNLKDSYEYIENE